ncbi:hypothetical protein [Chromobacterium amazonense]|uniref:Uncharacterized protein n=1 Tax=Chromobacterium amazonense TaxID=1382803 RepID=A0ABU8V2M0_9NEIS|nr:hypothetical protein [Chromobacterium amazonense]MDQ4539265.1 hypothetical protein [Chromobacterium amazonense]
MKDFLIFIAALAVAVLVWKLLTKWLRAKGHRSIVVVPLGLVVSVFAFVMTAGSMLPTPPKKPEKAETVAQKAEVDKVAAPTVKPEAKPTEASKPAAVPLAEKSPPKTLGLSSSKLVVDIEIKQRTESPLRDGTRRELLTINPIMTLEAIGDPSDLSRYTLMFGVPNDDQAAALENAVYAAGIFANTFPQWNGKKDNAVDWFTGAIRKLTRNVEKNRSEPKPVTLTREGKQVKLSAIPSMGMIFLSVAPLE